MATFETNKKVAGAGGTARQHDRLVAIVALVGAAVLFAQTFAFPAVNWTPLGLAFWPRVVLGGIGGICVMLAIARQLGPEPAFTVNRREILLFAALVAFIGLLPFLGFALSCSFYVFGTSVWLNPAPRAGVGKAVLLSLATTGTIYAAFSLALNVDLPDGALVDLIRGHLND